MTDTGVLVIGSITIDVTAFAERLPGPGETVLGTDFTLVLGGKGANQAVAAAHFGATTWMVGCVGQDPFAELALSQLRDHGVGTERVRQVPGPTGVAHIRVDAHGQNDIVITPLANAHLTRADVDAALAALQPDVTVLLLQLEVPADISAYAAHVGRAAGLTVILDPAPAVPIPDQVWRDIDIVTPNESEATRLTGIPVTDVASAVESARWFADRGVRLTIITLGAHGAVTFEDGTVHSYEPFAVTAVDTTSAGDAFTGTLAAALTGGADLGAAVRFGMAAGAVAVTRPGASPSLPSRQEILDLANASASPPS